MQGLPMNLTVILFSSTSISFIQELLSLIIIVVLAGSSLQISYAKFCSQQSAGDRICFSINPFTAAWQRTDFVLGLYSLWCQVLAW